MDGSRPRGFDDSLAPLEKAQNHAHKHFSYSFFGYSFKAPLPPFKEDNSDFSLQVPSFSNHNHRPYSVALISNSFTEAHHQRDYILLLLYAKQESHIELHSCMFFSLCFNGTAHALCVSFSVPCSPVRANAKLK